MYVCDGIDGRLAGWQAGRLACRSILDLPTLDDNTPTSQKFCPVHWYWIRSRPTLFSSTLSFFCPFPFIFLLFPFSFPPFLLLFYFAFLSLCPREKNRKRERKHCHVGHGAKLLTSPCSNNNSHSARLLLTWLLHCGGGGPSLLLRSFDYRAGALGSDPPHLPSMR